MRRANPPARQRPLAARPLACALLLLALAPPAHASLDRLRRFQKECFESAPCTMVLGRLGSHGCGQCTEDSVTAPVTELLQKQLLSNFLDLDADSVRRILLIPENLFFGKNGNFQATLPFSQQVGAVVVYPSRGLVADTGETLDQGDAPQIEKLSTDAAAPNQDFSIARNAFKYNNITQTITQFIYYPFNIFRVNASAAATIRSRVLKFTPLDVTSPGRLAPTYVLQSNGRMHSCPSDAAEQVLAARERAAGQGQDVALPGLYRTNNASVCLKDNTCLPVGGQSVWSTYGELRLKNILAVTAPLDSTAFFHDLAQGAAEEVASVATLMAVAEAVGKYARSPAGTKKNFVRQPAYFAFNAQAWGWAGSSRFLEDVQSFVCKKAVNISALEQGCLDPYMPSLRFRDFAGANFTLINIGGLVNPLDPGRTLQPPADLNFYSHSIIPDAADSNITSKPGLLVDSAAAASSANETVAVRKVLSAAFGKTLSAGRSAVPPDASQSFAQYAPESAAVSVSNWETTFTNLFYHSQYDNITLLPKSHRQPLDKAASGIARAVIALAYGLDAPPPAADVPINRTTIDSFVECLTSNWTVTHCDLAREYQGEATYERAQLSVKSSNYAGVFVPFSRSSELTPSSYYKNDLIATFLAYQNRFSQKAAGADNSKTMCEVNKDCNGFVQALNANVTRHSKLRVAYCSRNLCVASDTFTHNAYGSGLDSLNADQSSFEVNLTRTMGGPNATAPQAPQFAESYWDGNLGVCGFTEDSSLFGVVILLGGFGILAASFIISCILQRSIVSSGKGPVDDHNAVDDIISI
jgi:nicastrin